jgi:hypothetical protein
MSYDEYACKVWFLPQATHRTSVVHIADAVPAAQTRRLRVFAAGVVGAYKQAILLIKNMRFQIPVLFYIGYLAYYIIQTYNTLEF